MSLRRTSLAVLFTLFLAATAAAKGELEIRVLDRKTGEPIAVRMHLKDSRGRVVKPPKGVPFWKDHFVISGSIVLELPQGHYTFEMERGLEYKWQQGYFDLKDRDADNKTVEMDRFIDMTKEGWWSGDLYVDRPAKEIELLMLADDLHVAPLIAWDNKPREQPLAGTGANKKDLSRPVRFDGNRFYGLLAGKDDRAGGLLLFHDLEEPLTAEGFKPEYPSSVELLKQARSQGGKHVDIGRPFAWDLPVWIASGMVDSIQIANDHQQRDSTETKEQGRPRPSLLYPGKLDNGRWSQDIYFHLLNCGLRLPPTAGSGTGVVANPLGYNRVYVHCGEELTWQSWWENLRKGRVVVTNGPLLQPRVNGELPGHIFQADAGKTVELQIALNLSTREKIDYLEVIQDGKVVHEVRLEEWAQQGGHLPPVTFERSGWMLIRARTNNAQTYRFAMTGPYYVEIGYQPTISKASAQFFYDWVYERAKNLKLADETERAEVLQYHRAARDFWQQKLDEANAE